MSPTLRALAEEQHPTHPIHALVVRGIVRDGLADVIAWAGEVR